MSNDTTPGEARAHELRLELLARVGKLKSGLDLDVLVLTGNGTGISSISAFIRDSEGKTVDTENIAYVGTDHNDKAIIIVWDSDGTVDNSEEMLSNPDKHNREMWGDILKLFDGWITKYIRRPSRYNRTPVI